MDVYPNTYICVYRIFQLENSPAGKILTRIGDIGLFIIGLIGYGCTNNPAGSIHHCIG